MRNLLAACFAASYLLSCSPSAKMERPGEVWVFRSVLDEKPRMITAALSDEIWVAYDAQRASLYKAWEGGVNFDGAVYTTVHGPQPTSKGYDFYTDQKEDIEWFIISNGEKVIPEINYRGHKITDQNQLTLMYQLVFPKGAINVFETPEMISRGDQIGLSRKFIVNNAGENQVGLNLKVSSLINERDLLITGKWEATKKENSEYKDGSSLTISGTLMLNSNEPTIIKSYFHKGVDSIEMTSDSVIDSVAATGAMLINNSDCQSCHNEQVKTVGPAYISIARKYNDTNETISMLAGRIKKGGKGIWGEALMTPHPQVGKVDATKMAKYILSLDDDESGESRYSWHLGEKTIPMKFQDGINIDGKLQGLAAYKYLYSGDIPNFDLLKESESPMEAALVPQVHVREAMDLGNPNERVAILMKGMLFIEESASYSFRLISDDGSKLYIDGGIVIDHGGLHSMTPKDGEVYLEDGDHKLEIQYFQGPGGGGVSFQLFDKQKGVYKLVPATMLATSAEDYLQTQEYVAEEDLIKSIPGDRQMVSGVHPSFDLFQARPDDFRPRVGGIDFLSEDEMLVCTWDSLGPVYKLENFRAENPADIKVIRIASGLAEPLGLKVVEGEVYVLQKQELTKLIDEDGYGIIDVYETVCDDWKVSANFHEFAFGLAYKEGYFYAALATAILPGGASAQPQIQDRGKIVKIGKDDGSLEFVSSGLRTPNGIGLGIDDEVFVADNQGDWLPASRINHVKKGAFFGSRSVDFEGTENLEMDYPVVWLPQDEIGNSPGTPLYLDKGPYKDQMIHCEVTHGGVKRVFVEKVNGNYQGAVFRFSQGIEAGVNRMQWAPDGSLLLGGIGASGNWRQNGKLNYGLQRMVYNGKPTFEMLKVKAKTYGFEIEFTEPIKEGQQISEKDFSIEQYYFNPTAEYGGPKLGLEELEPTRFALSEDRRRVYFELEDLKEKHVVYIRIKRPFISDLDQELWTTEAWYTLNAIPEDSLTMPSEYSVEHNSLSATEIEQGWELLFDGSSTNGFRNYNKESLGNKWRADNGTLHFGGKSPKGLQWQSDDGGDLIITDKPYRNFEMSIDWKIVAGGNSGIIYGVVEDTKYLYPWNTGMEMQLLDNVKHPDGQIVKHRAGDLYDIIESEFVAVNPAEEWNRVRLIVKNGQVQHWLNGYKIVETELWNSEWDSLIAGSKFKSMPDFGRSKEGHIVLQDHSDEVWFRNVKIRELD